MSLFHSLVSSLYTGLPKLLMLGGLWVLCKAAYYLLQRSPLDNVRGPKSTSWLKGNVHYLTNRRGWFFMDQLDQYNGVARVAGLLGSKVLYVFDPLALQHIITKEQHNYEPASWFVASLRMTFGLGLLSTYGDHHRKQRKMLNPVFSIAHMRNMTPIFYTIAHKLRDAINAEVKNSPIDLDILAWMGRTALELIGQGGLGYSFDPLTENVHNKYGQAFVDFVPTIYNTLGVLRYITHYFLFVASLPFNRLIAKSVPTRNFQKLLGLVDSMTAMSKEVFEGKKRAIAAGNEAELEQVGQGKDIMSILLKANMLASEDDKLADEELLGQIVTLVFAATDTTSGALTQILQLLAQHPDVQEKLRAELQEAVRYGEIPYDELSSLPYLDAICRETLRLYPPVSYVFREATHANSVPLSQPVRGEDGTMLSEIMIPKGTMTVVGIRACNRNKAIWGEDALEWKPERWMSSLPDSVVDARIPGVYSNLMTFFGGGRACIGFKFSQLEMKIVLSVLIGTFKFSMPEDTKEKIVWNLASVKYPTVGDTTAPAFPMRVERLAKA